MTPQPLPISVCMIAGPEAGRIRRALASVAGWAAEINVVINDDVTDGTDRIAAEGGARVFREPWKGYVAQMNSASEKAGQPWVLGLDADEVVSPELAAEIQKLFSGPEKLAPYAAFSFPRCTQYCGRWIRHGDWYPSRKIRLWRRGQGHWGGADPHYSLVVGGRTGKLKGDLLHYTTDSFNHELMKMIKYTDIFVTQCVRQNRTVSGWDLMFRPAWRFLRSYVFRLGVLDGRPGYHIACMEAFYTFLRYAKTMEHQRHPSPPP
jgi:glycosyltransferase involved in cell wall biosynthesis